MNMRRLTLIFVASIATVATLSGVVAADSFEPNNDFSSAAQITEGEYSSEITQNDVDIYAVSLSKGETISVSADGGGGGDLNMYLYNSAETSVASSADFDSSEQLEYTATNTGTYYVEIYTNFGESTPYTLDLQVGDTRAYFTYTPKNPSVSEQVSFDASRSNYIDGVIDSYSWEFGDGATGTGIRPTHTYSSSGDYMVTLTVTSNNGTTDTMTKTVSVGSGGTTDSDGDGINDSNDQCDNEAEDVDGTQDNDGCADTSTGGGSDTGALQSTGGTAQSGGQITVSFTGTNNDASTKAFVLKITKLPSGFTIANRSDDGGTWDSGNRTWLFQSVSPSSFVNPSITLNVPSGVSDGQYTVEASWKDSNGIVDTATATVTVGQQSLVDAVAGNDNNIGNLEILNAIRKWRTGQTVAGQTISNIEILNLISKWRSSGSDSGSNDGDGSNGSSDGSSSTVFETDFDSDSISSVWNGDTDEYSNSNSYLKTDGRSSGEVNPVIYKSFNSDIKSIEIRGVANEESFYGLDVRIGPQPQTMVSDSNKSRNREAMTVGYHILVRQRQFGGVVFGTDDYDFLQGDKDKYRNSSFFLSQSHGGNEHDISVNISETSGSMNEFAVRYDGNEIATLTNGKYQNLSTVAIQFDAENQRIDYIRVTKES